jgi:hypothetical protein
VTPVRPVARRARSFPRGAKQSAKPQNAGFCCELRCAAVVSFGELYPVSHLLRHEHGENEHGESRALTTIEHAFCCWTWTQSLAFLYDLTSGMLCAVCNVDRRSQSFSARFASSWCCSRLELCSSFRSSSTSIRTWLLVQPNAAARLDVHEKAHSFPMLLVQPHAVALLCALADVHV